ncbi:hypothetical protein T492DRAFT_867892 [Pavlovales sp. CCMP2436]|nr:hypothetical protein T492DRAFT_867892 [Pavlovales sp. CCMP2436]
MWIRFKAGLATKLAIGKGCFGSTKAGRGHCTETVQDARARVEVEERAGGNAAGDPSTNYWRLPTGTCCHQPQQPTRSLRPDAMSRAEQAGGLPDELQSAVNARYEGLGHNAAGIGPLTLDIADEMGSMPHDPREILKAAIAKADGSSWGIAERVTPTDAFATPPVLVQPANEEVGASVVMAVPEQLYERGSVEQANAVARTQATPKEHI